MAPQIPERYGWRNRWSWRATRLSRRIRHGLRRGARRPLAPWRALPSFLILGAHKSGTSSLYAYLHAHPQVVGAAWKELYFFGPRFSKGTRWYRAHFPLRRRLERENAVTGEATPYYLFHPCAAEQVTRTLPDARLIVLLRNPVDRAISHYWHQVSRGRERLPLPDALDAEPERLGNAEDVLRADCSRPCYNHLHFAYTGRGLYAKQLKRYDRHFDRGQLLVLKSEDFFDRPQRTFDRVTDFLGLQPWSLQQKKPRNTGSYPETSTATRARLERFFRPHNRALYEHLGTDEAWWDAPPPRET